MAAEKKKPTPAPTVKPAGVNKNCFIITPIGGRESATRRSTDGLIRTVIKPVLKKFKLAPLVSHEMYGSGSINKEIIRHLLEDQLVIANLTGLNPNAMYELAVRHAIRKPAVTLAAEETSLPFDLFDLRTIFYVDDFYSVSGLRRELEKAIRFALDEKESKNPIYDVADAAIIKSGIKPGSFEDFVVSKMESMEKTISRFTREVPRSTPHRRYVIEGLTCKTHDEEQLVSQTLRGNLFFTVGKSLEGDFGDPISLMVEDTVNRDHSEAFESILKAVRACKLDYKTIKLVA